MNYIVFDLEWNQNPVGRKHPDSRLPFEIIEIGAVKLNEKREIIDTFQCLIKPKVYHWIHDSIHEVIHVERTSFSKSDPQISGMVRTGISVFYLGKPGCNGASEKHEIL